MIFEGLIPADGHDCLAAAVSAVLARARQRGLWTTKRERWSTVELGLTDADVAWLQAWAEQLRGVTLLPWLNSWRQHEAEGLTGAGSVGLLLMLMAAEAARRGATEGSLWPTVSSQFAGDVRRLLFLRGQPTAEHKQALESAAWELGLRHVFGIDGLHNWVTSIYLQFGFTRRGFEANLPLWIAAPQNRSNAVESLLAGPLSSRTFQDLWSALTNYRHRNLSAARLEAVLEQSSWILPEWRQRLLHVAQTKMHLEGREAHRNSLVESGDGVAPDNVNFLSIPTLRWDGVGTPAFLCDWQYLADLNLPEDEYTLSLDGRETAKLRRLEEGGFKAYPEDPLRLPPFASQVAVLLDGEKQIALTQILTCWDDTEDVSVFRMPSGDRIADPWVDALHTKSSYVLIYAADLVLDPPAARWVFAPDSLWRFALLPSPHPEELQLLVPEGVTLWKPIRAALTGAQWDGDTSIVIPNRDNSWRWGEKMTVLVRHPATTSISFARSQGQSLPLAPNDGGTRIGPFVLTPGGRTIVPDLVLGISSGDLQRCLRCTLPLTNLVGALHLTGGVRCPLFAKTILTTLAAQTGLFQVFPNKSWKAGEEVLFEGDMAVGKPPIRPAVLPTLAGYGASLSLRSRAYNDREDPLMLAQEVVNPGEISGVIHEVDGTQRDVHVRFRRAIQPDSAHCLFWWGRDGSQHLLEPNAFSFNPQEREWQFSAPTEWGEPTVIAASYAGARLGAWWSWDWDKLLEDTSEATQTAALVRWLRLPILSKSSFRFVQKFAHQVPDEVLAAWVGNAGLPETFEWGPSDERWPDAVRQVFSGWQPDVAEARRVLKLLAPASLGETEMRVQSAARLLMRVDPNLTAKVLGVWLRDFSVERYAMAQTRFLCTQSCQALAETTGSLDLQAARLLQEAAATMKCDDQFVKRGLLEKAVAGFKGQPIESFDRCNIALALSVMPFRRLLALRLLQEVCP